jgi:hypothetical protein
MSKLNEPSKIDALIDALRAEQNRRLQERMDAGELPTIVVTGVPRAGDADVRSFCDDGGPITVVITGVPRTGDPDFEYDAPPSCPFSGPERDEPTTCTSEPSLRPGEELRA